MSFDLRRVTAGYLPLTDALAASLVNREWLTAVRHADYLWRPRFAAAFPYELELVDLETTSTFASIDWVLLWGETVRRRFKSVSNVEFGCGAPSQRSSDSQPVVSSEASAISRVFGTAIRSASSVLPSAVTKWLFPPPLKILMTGLNSTGKTTILSALKLGRPAAYSTIPTVGFNVEDIPSSRDGVLPFTCWEVGGGGAAMRALWRHFFHGVHGHIYVVDGSDRDRLVESGSALAALRVSLHSLPCLVYVNKQDVPGCMLPGEVAARLDACKALPGVWCVQGCSGATAQGLAEGLVWLSAAVAANKMCAYSSQEN
jgi:hypothetical protein